MSEPLCRITIEFDDDMGYWRSQCICGVHIKEQLIPTLALAGCYDHFTENPHRGFMFIDFREAKP